MNYAIYKFVKYVTEDATELYKCINNPLKDMKLEDLPNVARNLALLDGVSNSRIICMTQDDKSYTFLVEGE